eukprot:TRINITY_DN20155_c0_g2_i2.p1 TRINITY_DN20155_c0_g2~~TRINITY_DN20155_c0_g2_i2.p1  ORF type:complete len:927 (+),score=176.25 TRINITY_DN20155_c0_g2_i2:161-2941(+)
MRGRLRKVGMKPTAAFVAIVFQLLLRRTVAKSATGRKTVDLKIDMRKVKDFDAFKKKFDKGDGLEPAKLRNLLGKNGGSSWSRDQLVQSLGSVQVWPRDLSSAQHLMGARIAPLSLKEYLESPPSADVVYEHHFSSATRAFASAYEKAYGLPAAFLKDVYMSPFLGIGRDDSGVSYQSLDTGGRFALWVAQVHGSSRWRLRPGTSAVLGTWPWASNDRSVVTGEYEVELSTGDGLFVPSGYAHTWQSTSEASVLFGFQGNSIPHGDMAEVMRAITHDDVDAMVKRYEMFDQGKGSALLHGMTHHAMHCGHTKILKRLASIGASFDEEDPRGATLLHGASSTGQADAVLFAIDQGADPNVKRTEDGLEPIHAAALAGHADVIGTFAKKAPKALVRKAARTGKQPLHIATIYNHQAVVKELLQGRANVAGKDSSGHQALHFAAEGKSLDMLKLLLDSRASVGAVTSDGETPLHRAAQSGRGEAVSFLLDRRAQLDARRKSGHTAVHSAAFKGHRSVLEILKAHGADLNPKDGASASNVHSPEALAVSAGHTDVVEYIRTAAKKGPSIDGENAFAAAKAGHVAMLDKVLLKGVWSPEREDAERASLAHAAVEAGHLAVVSHLLESAGSAAKTNAHYKTLMATAALYGHAELIETLAKRGFPAEGVKAATSSDDSGNSDATRSPTQIAVTRGHVAALDALRKFSTPAGGETDESELLPLGVVQGHAGIVNYLVERRASVNAGAARPKDHIHVAAMLGHAEVARALLDHRADVEARDSEGLRPACYAILGADNNLTSPGHASVLRLLAGRGADVGYDAMNKKLPARAGDSGKEQPSLLDVAIGKGDIDVLAIIAKGKAWTADRLKRLSDHLGRERGAEAKLRFDRATELRDILAVEEEARKKRTEREKQRDAAAMREIAREEAAERAESEL